MYLPFILNQVLFLMLRFILCNVGHLSVCNFLFGWLNGLSVDHLASWLPIRSGEENAPAGCFVLFQLPLSYIFLVIVIYLYIYTVKLVFRI